MPTDHFARTSTAHLNGDAWSRELTFKQVAEIVWRGRRLYLALLIPLLVLSVVVSTFVAPGYTATATLLFARPDLAPDAGHSISGADIAVEITASGARVMTLANLRDIARERLYSGKSQDDLTLDEAAMGLLHSVKIDLLQSMRGKSEDTVGFTIGYSHRDPAVAQAVVADLVKLYVNDNDSEGERGIETAVALLHDDALRLSKEVDALESDIASFKNEHARELPELREYNLQYLSTLKQDLASLQREIREREQRRGQRRADLAETRPTNFVYGEDGKRLYTPEEQLEFLETRYLSRSVQLSAQHPEMLSMQRTMQTLRAHLAGTTTGGAAEAQPSLTAADLTSHTPVNAERAPALKSYPKMASKPKLQTDTRAGGSGGGGGASVQADNPIYLRLVSELESIDAEIANMKESEGELQDKIQEYEMLLSRAPEVERRLADMMRVHEISSERLAEIRKRELDARLEAAVGAKGAGPRFHVAEPPRVPRIPNTRKRTMVAALCSLFAFAISTLIVVVKGRRQRVIYDLKGLEQVVGSHAAVAIPTLSARA